MERNVRLATGLTLFAYAACHFASHATGLFRLAAMDAVGRTVLLWPWQTWAGRAALFAALFTHAGLGLRALHRRRHLRIPAAEAWQLGLGLLIPLLLIPHATNVRLGAGLYGLDDSYYRILYQYWLTRPAWGLLRQFALLSAVWVHGCVGLHFWLRHQRWYLRWRPSLLCAAILLPFLAVLGLVNAGWDTAMTAALDPAFAAAHGPAPPGAPRALAMQALRALWEGLQYAYAWLVAAVLLSRLGRNARARRVRALRITYPDGRAVTVPRGFSVLEASRWARVPHASACGGRGRCSTCRVRVTEGLDALPPPSEAERETLRRVGAAPAVRLACQLRPGHDLAVVPLLQPPAAAPGLRAAAGEASELLVTALFIDLRDSTGLAAGRLPFDALFIVDRYVQRVTAAVQAHGGHVTSVAGDGVMSVFGVDAEAGAKAASNAASGALGAVAAVGAICDGLGQLSHELGSELERPLRFGIGLHSGVSAVGSMLVMGHPTVQFLGDTGNVAARLEALTKERGCVAIISDAVFAAAGRRLPEGLPRATIQLRGREALPLDVVLLGRQDEAGLLRPTEAAPSIPG